MTLAVLAVAESHPPDVPGAEFGMTAGEVKALMRSKEWTFQSASPADPSGADFAFHKGLPYAVDSAFIASVGAKGLFQTLMRYSFTLSDTGRKQAFEMYDRLRGELLVALGRPDPFNFEGFLEYDVWIRGPLYTAVFINEAKANDLRRVRHYEVWRMTTHSHYVVKEE